MYVNICLYLLISFYLPSIYLDVYDILEQLNTDLNDEFEF